jgi:hypothetical protein
MKQTTARGRTLLYISSWLILLPKGNRSSTRNKYMMHHSGRNFNTAKKSALLKVKAQRPTRKLLPSAAYPTL